MTAAQMFGRAKKILASELMYACVMEEQEAIDFLENLLEDIGGGRGEPRVAAGAAPELDDDDVEVAPE